MSSAGVVIVMLVAVAVMQQVVIGVLKREVRECRRKMGWRMQVDAGKKDLVVVR